MSVSALALLAISIAGCDSSTSPATADQATAADFRVGARSPKSLVPFVAMGVSIEEGRQSNGTTHTSQEQAWPAQFARAVGIPFSQPLVGDPGCPPPSIAPLISGATAGPFDCAPSLPGVVLPANDLGVTNSSTHDALFTTPEIAASQVPFRGLRYSRILPPGQTQVTAMLTEHPRLVAVDLGGAEMGAAEFGDPSEVTPYEDWRKDYDVIIAQVKSTGARGLLVWYNSDPSVLAGERRGWELWANRAEFAAQGLVVPKDCHTSGRDNLINVADILFQLVDAKVNGGTFPIISCTDVPGGEDDILTPSDVEAVKAVAARYLAHIRHLARENGYAVITLDDVLHRRPEFKPALSFTRMLYSDHPYGPLLSLDETHPNRRGHAIIAAAAAKALSETYGIEFGSSE